MNELMKSLAYFPWVALFAACVIALTFLVLWSIAEKKLDREADTAHYLTAALEECEYELAQERAALDRIAAMLNDENDKLVRELAAAKREINRLKSGEPHVDITGNRFEPGGPISIHGPQR